MDLFGGEKRSDKKKQKNPKPYSNPLYNPPKRSLDDSSYRDPVGLILLGCFLRSLAAFPGPWNQDILGLYWGYMGIMEKKMETTI